MQEINLLFEVLVFCKIDVETWPKRDERFWKDIPMDQNPKLAMDDPTLDTTLTHILLAAWEKFELQTKIWETPRLAAATIACGISAHYQCIPSTIALFFRRELQSLGKPPSDVNNAIKECIRQHQKMLDIQAETEE